MTPSIEQASRSTIHWDPTLQFDPEPPPSRRATAGQRGAARIAWFRYSTTTKATSSVNRVTDRPG